jgi:hypothetical protein
MHVKGISPKLAAAIGPPLTAVVTAMILTNTVDRTSLAALASILLGALLGYHAPVGAVKSEPITVMAPVVTSSGPGTNVSFSAFQPTKDPDTDGDTMLEPELAAKPTPADVPPDEIDSPSAYASEALS